MLTINKFLPQGEGLSVVLRKRAATVQLAWEQRQHHHLEATDSLGRPIQVTLPEGTRLHSGDVLVAEEGSLIVVEAATQAVMAATPCPEHGTPLDLLRAAYWLGGKHVPVALQADRLILTREPALADALRRMGLVVEDTVAAFEPQTKPTQDHDHDHEHGHAHTPRGKPVRIAVKAAESKPHVHGPHCNHGHDHSH